MRYQDRFPLPHALLLLAILLCAASGTALAAAPQDGVIATRQARATAPVTPRPPQQRAPLGIGPGNRLFFMTGADNAPCVRAMPDVNGDGRDEVLVGIDESQVDNIFLLDGASSNAATVLWSIETMDGVSGGSPWGDQALVPISDADGNTHANILLGTAWGGRTAYGLDSLNGTILWKLDTYLEPDSGWVYSLAELNDITGDGVPEVAFGAGSDNDTVYLVDGAGMLGNQATVLWRYAAADGVLSVRSIGDVNGDGDHDIIAAVGDLGQEMVCLDGGTALATGNELWDYDAGATVFAAGVLPDITGDGIDEALAAVWVNDGSAVRCLNGATGALLWSSTDVNSFAQEVDILQDVNNDGEVEVVVSSFENAVTVLDGKDGTLVWKTTVGTLNGGDVWTARAIGDLNGDGINDVIAGSFDYHVYALDGTDGTIFWAYDTGNRVFSVYPVGDLNGDGRPEVVAGTQDTNNNVVVHVLDGASDLPIFADGFESGSTSAWSATVP